MQLLSTVYTPSCVAPSGLRPVAHSLLLPMSETIALASVYLLLGGVTELTRDQFEMVNGYSNSFWGWGGEDDDMHSRIRIKRMKISRYPMAISRYLCL